MKLTLKLIVLFIIAILFAVLSTYGPGHVVIFMSKYRLDLSLTTLLFAVVLCYFLAYFIFTFSSSVYHIPSRIRHYRKSVALTQSRNYFNIAAANYFQANYVIAYNSALKSISKHISIENKFPVLLLAINAVRLMDLADDRKVLAKLDKLLGKISSKDDIRYVYTELVKINETKNNQLYSVVLDRLR